MRFKARPTASCPDSHESGIASNRPTMVGDIQRKREVAMRKAETPAKRPSRVCQRWRRTMSLMGIEPSSRRCGCQPVSRPSRIWNTEPDWMSI
jgi:DNA/RNA-binding domain of Phe-tRNA-synthetase-like protein